MSNCTVSYVLYSVITSTCAYLSSLTGYIELVPYVLRTFCDASGQWGLLGSALLSSHAMAAHAKNNRDKQ
jgi:hypothetical protein